jgi:hypothetical protein
MCLIVTCFECLHVLWCLSYWIVDNGKYFRTPSLPFLACPFFTILALVHLILIWTRFSFYHFTHDVSLLCRATLMPTAHLGLVPYGCPTVVAWVCRGLRPVNVAFALLIFILIFLSFRLSDISFAYSNCIYVYFLYR